MVRAEYTNKIFSNKTLTSAILLSAILQFIVVYSPLNTIFKTIPLGILELGYILLTTIIVFFIGVLLNKLIKRITAQED